MYTATPCVKKKKSTKSSHGYTQNWHILALSVQVVCCIPFPLTYFVPFYFMSCNLSISLVSQAKNVLQQYIILLFVKKATTVPAIKPHCSCVWICICDVKQSIVTFYWPNKNGSEMQGTIPIDVLMVKVLNAAKTA